MTPDQAMAAMAPMGHRTLQLFQVVFAHEDDHAVPMTRHHLYPSKG